MLRRLGVRGKILLTLAVPILVLAIASGWVTWTSLQAARTASQTADLVASLAAQDSAGSAFAAERSLNIAASFGIPGAKEGLEPAMQQTDAALDARAEALATLEVDALDVRVRRAISATLADRAQIDKLQEQVLAGTVTEQAATDGYARYITNALDIASELAATTDDSTLRQRLETYLDMDEAMLAVVYERPIVGGVLAGAATGKADPSLVLRMVSTIQSTDEEFDVAQKSLDRLPGGFRLPAFDGDLGTIRGALGQGAFQDLDPAVAAGWSQLTDDWVKAAQPVRDEVREETSAYARWLSDGQRDMAIYTAGGAFGLLTLTLLIALTVARRIVNPLRRLTVATAEIRDRLPAMVEQMAVPGQTSTVDLYEIPVESRDEIGRLAQSFNDVNSTTVAVAKEQAALRGSIAEMFVNVARRDQVLLNRQLAFLDELERSEEDPSTLSNLFRLDHLATRMRRNAESLLVLAGIDSGRRVRQPMPVSDVVRTASSEIELYDRIRLDLDADPLMLGHNALNAAHLLAELLENATMFSEPHTPVEVTVGRDHRGVVVTVRDHGLGMTPEESAEANSRVASRSAQDAVGAQRLGLYVVGRLADRLGAVIAFGTGPDGMGTMVTVALPHSLFLPDDAVPLPQPTDPLEAATQRGAASLGQARAFDEVTSAAFGHPTPAFGHPTPAFGHPAPAGPLARQAPEPERVPAAFASSSLVQAEPPAALPVDLEALTDGTTMSGMPRRRTARPEEPHGSGALVLPPLPNPVLAHDLGSDESWVPPSDVEQPGASLPSRQRVEVAFEAEPEETPVVAVEQRTGLFSSFRTLTDLESTAATTGTLHLDPSVEDPASLPVPLTFVAQTPVAPEAPPSPYQASASAPVYQAAPSTTAAPRFATTVAPQAHPFEAGVGPVLPAAPVHAPVPTPEHLPSAASAASPFAPVAHGAGADRPAEDSPAFDELMADLPSRRASRDPIGQTPAARMRGLFGRRPEEMATSAIPLRAPELAPSAQAVTGLSQLGMQGLAAPALDEGRFVPIGSASAPATLGPRPGAPAPLAPASYQALAPAGPAWGAAASSSTGGGGSALPLRSSTSAGDPLADPLDPYAIPDTIEARSEWMASAVLYEEMSSLLRRGVFEEQRVTPTHDEDTYRPVAAAPTPAHGLVRRAARPTVNPAVDRFTARIERDPEQLRSRLSAFQSATTRGRSAGEDEGPSTWAPAP